MLESLLVWGKSVAYEGEREVVWEKIGAGEKAVGLTVVFLILA